MHAPYAPHVFQLLLKLPLEVYAKVTPHTRIRGDVECLPSAGDPDIEPPCHWVEAVECWADLG